MNPDLNGIHDVSPPTVERPDMTVVAESEAISSPASSVFTWLIKPDVIKDNLDKVSQQIGETITSSKIPDAERLRKVAVIAASGLAVGMAVHFLRQSRTTEQPNAVTE